MFVCRLTETFNSYEEFKILMMLFKNIEMLGTVNNAKIQSCLDSFSIVQEYDIYKVNLFFLFQIENKLFSCNSQFADSINSLCWIIFLRYFFCQFHWITSMGFLLVGITYRDFSKIPKIDFFSENACLFFLLLIKLNLGLGISFPQ